ncbi:MAG TPA: formate hydrogenlyase [Gammaproteobacteria bacterium]|nr:formate hydrogenlyase [Gammaproteobacteria bacterium]
MNTVPSALLLILVPLLPLLLVFPALRSRFSRPCYIALLPALILLAVPQAVSIDLPWLLMGSGLGIDDGAGRLLLAMSVLLWAVAASLLHSVNGKPVDDRLTSCFLLTLAGNLGAILATDLVGFFTFSSLMGYGFYALLIAGGGAETRRAARVYLVCLIVADLALFEALLIAAATARDLDFEAVRQAMAQSASPGLYLSMVLAGFALKAGIWPLHFWLPLAFRSFPPAVALLLGAVPVAIALLGFVRWLPLGEVRLPALGLIIQAMGAAAMFYAILAAAKRAQPIRLPACAAIFASGLFTTFLGVGLGDPVAWNRHGNVAYFLIVFLGSGVAVLVIITGWRRARGHYPTMSGKPVDDSPPWFERWSGALTRWAAQVGGLSRLCAAWRAKVGGLRQIRAWQRALHGSERFLQRWAYAITLFLLLGIVVVFAGASSWI